MTEQAKKTPMPMAERMKRMAEGRNRFNAERRAAKEQVRAAAMPDRAATHTQTREPVREPVHEPQREKGAVLGRDGEVLSRRRKLTGDMFEIPNGMVPAGWEYQWNVFSVTGNTDIVMDHGLVMRENGWRPVPQERHPAYPVMRGGCRLEERPKILCDEAREEDWATARRQVADRDESLMGRKANVAGAMQGGFEMSRRYRGAGADIKMNMERSIDIPRPQHTLAGPDE